MTNNQKRAKSSDAPVLIAMEDAAIALGVHVELLPMLMERSRVALAHDHRGRPAFDRRQLDVMAVSQHYSAAVVRSILREQRARTRAQRDAARLDAERADRITEYRGYLVELQAVHARQLAAANAAGIESAGMAVYLLLSKVIALLKMLVLCLEHGHWFSGVLIRDIDECLDLAQFFAHTHSTDPGAKALRRWFRFNEAPKHAEMRKAIADRFAQLLGPANHRAVLDELYHKKSKWNHPTYQPIREVAGYADGADLTLTSVDYGPCDHPYKVLELTEFVRSNFWSTYQGMALSLNLTVQMAQEDLDLLMARDRAFHALD